jgi:hypothetical protein
MDADLSIPANIQPVPDHIRGTDRVSPAMQKREGRPGKGRPFDLGARREADEELSRDGAAREERARPDASEEQGEHPAESRAHESAQLRPDDPGAPADGQTPSSPPAAESEDSQLDYQA